MLNIELSKNVSSHSIKNPPTLCYTLSQKSKPHSPCVTQYVNGPILRVNDSYQAKFDFEKCRSENEGCGGGGLYKNKKFHTLDLASSNQGGQKDAPSPFSTRASH